MKCVRKKIVNSDMFGHPVSLNFNKKGDTHNTLCGGMLSLFTRLFFLWYLFMRISVMV